MSDPLRLGQAGALGEIDRYADQPRDGVMRNGPHTTYQDSPVLRKHEGREDR